MIEQFFGKPATIVVAGAQEEDRFHLSEWSQGLRPQTAEHAFLVVQENVHRDACRGGESSIDFRKIFRLNRQKRSLGNQKLVNGNVVRK